MEDQGVHSEVEQVGAFWGSRGQRSRRKIWNEEGEGRSAFRDGILEFRKNWNELEWPLYIK